MIDLGKWPVMRVVGESVTPDQAGDILISTMPWFDTFPNHEGWDRKARMIGAEFGMPVQPVYEHGGNHSAWFRQTWDVFRPKMDAWREQYGVLDIMSLDGPCNNLITGTYRSWINWDGLVAGQFSIGKWPSEDDVLDFFSEVAQRFPYLKLTADLISEHPDQQGQVEGDQEYNMAIHINVTDGRADIEEGLVEPLILPDSWRRWQNSVDRMDVHGVSPERLRQAFAHLTRG